MDLSYPLFQGQRKIDIEFLIRLFYIKILHENSLFENFNRQNLLLLLLVHFNC